MMRDMDELLDEKDAEILRLKAELRFWVKANGPGGWIDNLRKRAGYDPVFAQRATAEPQRETKTLTERPERLQTGSSAPERVSDEPASTPAKMDFAAFAADADELMRKHGFTPMGGT